MFGKLGLPRVPHERDWFFSLGQVAPEQMRAIVDRLNLDSRTHKLADRFLNVGNGGGLYTPDSLARWWLWRANEVGSEQADGDLNSYLDAEQVEAWEQVWVFGLDVLAPVELTNTVSLVPWEQAPLSPLWLEVAKDNLCTPPSLRHPVSVIVRSKMIERDFTPQAPRAAHIPDYDSLVRLAYLLNAMPGICAVPGTRAFGLAPGTPPGPFGGYSWGAFHLEIKPRGRGAIPAISTELFRKLVAGVGLLNDKDAGKWTRALQRLAQAKSRADIADAALDLGVALEMVLLDGRVEQLSLAFRTRGAWLLGKTAAARAEIHDVLKRLYNIRSEVAHTGRSPSLEKMTDIEARALIAEGFSLAEQTYATLLLNGLQDWTALTLGASLPTAPEA
jgi:hypothetical protein